MTFRDEEKLDSIAVDQRVCIQAAAYTAYVELLGNKKPLSPREFHQKFTDNWTSFMDIEKEHE